MTHTLIPRYQGQRCHNGTTTPILDSVSPQVCLNKDNTICSARNRPIFLGPNRHVLDEKSIIYTNQFTEERMVPNNKPD